MNRFIAVFAVPLLLVSVLRTSQLAAEFPPEATAQQFEDKVYETLKRTRLEWTEEQCREFAGSLRQALEQTQFELRQVHIEHVLNEVEIRLWIVPGAPSGEAEEFALEKAAWRRRILDVAVPKWQRTSEEKQKIWTQCESVLDYQIACLMSFFPEVPDSFFGDFKKRSIVSNKLNFDSPFSLLFVRSLTDEEMGYVWSECKRLFEAMPLEMEKRSTSSFLPKDMRERFCRAIEQWNLAFASGDEEQMRLAFSALFDAIDKMNAGKFRGLLSVYTGRTMPQKSEEYAELSKKVADKFRKEAFPEIEKMIAEASVRLNGKDPKSDDEGAGNETQRPQSDEERGNAGSPDGNVRKAPKTGQPGAPAGTAHQEAGKGAEKPGPSGGHAAQNAAFWPTLCIAGVVLLLCVSLVIRARARKKTANS